MPTATETAKVILDETAFQNIYKGVYKDGPRRVEINFSAPNLQVAKDSFEKYIRTLDGTTHNRINIIGKVTPFALNLEEEIRKLKETR